jgi:hypothetical protein
MIKEVLTSTARCNWMLSNIRSEGTQYGTWVLLMSPASRWGIHNRRLSPPITPQLTSSSCKQVMIPNSEIVLPFPSRWTPFTCQARALWVLMASLRIAATPLTMLEEVFWQVAALAFSNNRINRRPWVTEKTTTAIMIINKKWCQTSFNNNSTGSPR